MANTILGLFRADGADDPLGDVKSLAAWVEKQPANDYLGLQEAMVRVLEDMAARQRKVTPSRVLAVLELDRISTPIQARLLKQFLQPSLSDLVRQRLWHACDDLARWFAYTYENLFEALQELFLSQKAKAQLPGVAARMFYYRGQQAKDGLFRYERWIPGMWRGLHAAYEATLKRGVARVPFALVASSPVTGQTSAEQEYVQILLMQRINTGNLSALQIELSALWLRGWARTLALTDPPLEGGGFWLDLGLGDGLLLRKPQSAQGALFYLDIAPLQKAIGNGLVELGEQTQRAGEPAVQAEAAERLALLQRVEKLWRPKAKPTERRGVRVKGDRPIHVAAGLLEITTALQSTVPRTKVLYRQVQLGEPTEVAATRVQPAFGRADPGLIEYNQENPSGWRILDSSESGCKLVSQTREAAQQKLGSLLGIQEMGDSRWKIGIVRRLKKFSGGQSELGIEFIAHHSSPIAPKPVATRDTGFSVDGIDVSTEGKGFNALYLPPTQSPGRVPRRSVVVPAQEYVQGRRFFLKIDNYACTIELATVLERTKEWVWCGFDMVTRKK